MKDAERSSASVVGILRIIRSSRHAGCQSDLLPVTEYLLESFLEWAARWLAYAVAFEAPVHLTMDRVSNERKNLHRLAGNSWCSSRSHQVSALMSIALRFLTEAYELWPGPDGTPLHHQRILGQISSSRVPHNTLL